MKVDPERLAKYGDNPTGYYVRSLHDGKWGSYDCSVLERESLLVWLRSRHGPNGFMEGLILGLLGYEAGV